MNIVDDEVEVLEISLDNVHDIKGKKEQEKLPKDLTNRELLRVDDVHAIYGWGKTSIWGWTATGYKGFPNSIKISPKFTAWSRKELDAFVSSLKAQG